MARAGGRTSSDGTHDGVKRWLNKWVGREAEFARLQSLASRPLTFVCGPRGSGKSRFVAEAASRGMLGEAVVADLKGVVQEVEAQLVVAEALGCTLSGPFIETISLAVAARAVTTIVLDRLDPACIETAIALADVVRVVATMRPHPDSPDIPRMDVGPLDLVDARKLFVARLEEQGVDAAQVDYEFALDAAGTLAADIEDAARRLASPLTRSPDITGDDEDLELAKLAFLCDPFTVEEATLVLGTSTEEAVTVLRRFESAGLLFDGADGLRLFTSVPFVRPPPEVCEWYCANAWNAAPSWIARRTRVLWRLVESFGLEKAAVLAVELGRNYITSRGPQVWLERIAPFGDELPLSVRGIRLGITMMLPSMPWEADARRILEAENPPSEAACLALQRNIVFVSQNGSLAEVEAFAREHATTIAALEPEEAALLEIRYQHARFWAGASPSECADQLDALLPELSDIALPGCLFCLGTMRERLGQYHEALRLSARLTEAARKRESIAFEAYGRMLQRSLERRVVPDAGWPTRVREDLGWACAHGLLNAAGWFEVQLAAHAVDAVDRVSFDASCERAMSYAARSGDTRYLRGWVDGLAVHFAAAEHRWDEARRLNASIDAWTHDLRSSQLMRSLALRAVPADRIEASLTELNELTDVSFPTRAPIVALLGVLHTDRDLAELVTAAARVAAGDVTVDYFNRFALGTLRALEPDVMAIVDTLIDAGPSAVCAADGAWVFANHVATDLRSRPVVAVLVRSLAAATAPLTSEDLGEALWPGETMTDDSLRVRIRSTIYQLRKLGVDVDFTNNGYVAPHLIVC